MQLGDNPQFEKLKQLRDTLPAEQPVQKPTSQQPRINPQKKYEKSKEQVFQEGIDELKNAMIPDLRFVFSGKFLIKLRFQQKNYFPLCMKGKLHLQNEKKEIISAKEFINKNCIQKQSEKC